MAIVGLGTDIVEIERLASNPRIDGLAKRVLSDSEYAVYLTSKQGSRFLAKRFAAKEAASKALGTGIAQGVGFKNFTISNDRLGKPILELSGNALDIATQLGAKTWHISISDEKRYALATVILET
ncbi:holo-ACP synthase [Alginatibacterium sediminis]|uniref:Holo-[acyl-carrier-protein] synthase n=1 Tax=Alginatibacterium sediminis TaxID=2164068 RepID=A0A420ED61_9ALTE|nr:holo-ACP synthase [Alginatibacterium sediminis]RKF18610.1 holo-ACP synthase [Alginatibacterium sediminis]